MKFNNVSPNVTLAIMLVYVMISGLTVGTLKSLHVADPEYVLAIAGLVGTALHSYLTSVSSTQPGPLASPDPTPPAASIPGLVPITSKDLKAGA